jgi:hypothetical protein
MMSSFLRAARAYWTFTADHPFWSLVWTVASFAAGKLLDNLLGKILFDPITDRLLPLLGLGPAWTAALTPLANVLLAVALIGGLLWFTWHWKPQSKSEELGSRRLLVAKPAMALGPIRLSIDQSCGGIRRALTNSNSVQRPGRYRLRIGAHAVGTPWTQQVLLFERGPIAEMRLQLESPTE